MTFNDVTKDSVFYTTTSRFVVWLGVFSQERQELWLPKDDLRDSSSWSSPPLILLRDIHSKLLNQFDCKEVCVSSPSQVNAGASGGLSSQDVVPQQQEADPLCIPKLNRLIEASFVRDENSASKVDVTEIPSQHRVTQSPTDTQPLVVLPGSQTYVCELAPRGTVKSALTTEYSSYR